MFLLEYTTYYPFSVRFLLQENFRALPYVKRVHILPVSKPQLYTRVFTAHINERRFYSYCEGQSVLLEFLRDNIFAMLL